MLKKFVLILTILLLCDILYAQEYDAKKICDCIYIIEGQERANQQYGINPKYVTCSSKSECERICLNTVNHKYSDWQNQTKEKDFLKYLAKKYCPFRWKLWLKNLKHYLNKK